MGCRGGPAGVLHARISAPDGFAPPLPILACLHPPSCPLALVLARSARARMRHCTCTHAPLYERVCANEQVRACPCRPLCRWTWTK